jgi:hypothetical protein
MTIKQLTTLPAAVDWRVAGPLGFYAGLIALVALLAGE